MSWILLAAMVLPLLLAPLALHPALRWTLVLAPLPALVAVVLVPIGVNLDLPWLLLGASLGLDETSRIFLLLTATVWILAAVQIVERQGVEPHAGRLRLLFLLAMAGNLWLILARDPIGFYVGFAIMGLASYGLIIHLGGHRRRRAGRTYLIMTLIGELALFVALLLMVQTQGVAWSLPVTAAPDAAVIALLLLGFGIKAGLMPLHVWLPLAYTAAPPPAAAVLSGAMSKAALLGWLRFLPLGQVALPEWGILFVLLGLVTLLIALGSGLLQSDPRTLLAYSSIGKAGLFALLLGLILLDPTLAPVGVAALTLYAAHHALVKSGLFLGLGLRDVATARPLTRGGLILLALAMAGAPLTSGALAKYRIKPLLESPGWVWLDLALLLATIATGLLMLRFVWLTWPAPRASSARRPGLDAISKTPVWSLGTWVLLVGLVSCFPFALGDRSAWSTNAGGMALALLIAAPVMLAVRQRAPGSRRWFSVRPPVDLSARLESVLAAHVWVGRTVFARWVQAVEQVRVWLYRSAGTLQPPPPDPERCLRDWPRAGLFWLGVTVMLLLMAAWTPAG